MTFDLCFALYNSSRWMEACVRALANVNYDTKQIALYFADNASQDDSVQLAERLARQYEGVFREFRILPQGENRGFGSASNAAARAGRGDYVFFCNVDTEIEPDAFEKLEEAIAGAPEAFGAFELRQFPYEHPKYYDPVTLETSWCSGACFVLRRDVFEKTGGFDESIFMYAEDVDLSWHIRALGYKLMYVPSAVIHHYAYRTAGEEKPVQLAGSVAGNLVLRLKYGTEADVHQWKKLYELVRDRIEAKPETKKVFDLQYARVRERKAAYRDFYEKTARPSGFRPSFLEFDYEFARGGAFYESHFPASQPAITVIVRTYRRPELLSLTLESLCHQTYRNFRVLVVEDGETPVSRETAESFAGRLDLQYIAVGTGAGRCRAGNIGLEHAQTEYVCFLDDDDYFFAEHLEVMACLISEHPDCGLFAAGSVEARCKAEKNPAHFTYLGKKNLSGDLRLVDFFAGNPIPIQAAVFRREMFEQYGGFDETLDALEDWDLWMRYLTHTRFACADKATSIFKVPADDDTYKERDRFISAYRKKVFEKMASYQGVITAQDIYGMFWRPDESAQTEKSAEPEDTQQELERLRASVEEIRTSRTWRFTLPLRLIPHLVRFLIGVVGGVLTPLLRWIGQGFQYLSIGVRRAMEIVCRLCDRVGPPAPRRGSFNVVRMRSFITLSRKSLCWRLLHRKEDEN